MRKKVCVYSLVEFASSSREHILQSFLGARWDSDEIVASAVQEKFGKTIDLALEETLRPYRTMLGTKSSHGRDSRTLRSEVNSEDGRDLELLPGSKPRLARPHVTVTRSEGKVDTRVEVGSEAQLDWAAALLRQAVPEKAESITREFLARHIESPQLVKPSPVKISGSLGGKDALRGVVKAAFNLLAATDVSVALKRCFDPVRDFVLDGVGKPGEHIRWLRQPPSGQLPRVGVADHSLALRACDGRVEGIAVFFGSFPYAIRLTDQYAGPDFSYSYIVDPFREVEPAELRHVPVPKGAIPFFDECDPELTKASIDFMKSCMVTFERLRRRRDFTNVLDEVMREYGIASDKAISVELASRIASETWRRWVERGGIKPIQRSGSAGR